MFRSIPMSNKLCFDKDVKRAWKIHQAKLRVLKSSVSKQRPQKFQFLDQRPKKIALQDVRNLEIDRQNHALMKKIKTIQSKGCKTSYTRMYQDLSQSKKKTLNEPYRKRELLKIVEQNQDMLKRLQHKRSEYNIRKMEKERKQIQKNISLISQYPFRGIPHSRTPVNLWSTLENFAQRSQTTPQLDFTFRGEKQIQDGRYMVTTYLSKGYISSYPRQFFLQMQNTEDRRQRFRIELPQQKAKDLLRISYKSCIETMISNLSVDHEKQLCFLRYSPNQI